MFTLASYTSVVRKGIHSVLCKKQFLNQLLNHNSYIPMLISISINEQCSTLLEVISFFNLLLNTFFPTKSPRCRSVICYSHVSMSTDISYRAVASST